MIRALRVLALAVAVAALAACSSSSGYSDLDRDATSADVLPTDLPAYASEDFVDGSVRFIDRYDGAEYFLARWIEMPGACVIVYRSADDWMGGCGTAGGTFTLGGIGLDVSVVTDGTPKPGGGTQVGSNIVVK